MQKNLELYVHIPFCMKKCSYCDFLSFPASEELQADYVKALVQEINAYGKKMTDYEVSTIYIGGGTPSWLDEHQLCYILENIYQSFSIQKEAEISMECNPGTITKKKMQKYRNAGINRLSIGLQSANNEELKLLGRVHTFEQFLKTYELAREADFSNINVDLMSGIPYQTTEKFLETLEKITNLEPEHISAYSLIIEQGTLFYEKYQCDIEKREKGHTPNALPTEEEEYRIYKATQDFLKMAGYEQYEISNYAKKGFACKHNIGYWTRENYLGLGLGSASLIENVRYTNRSDLSAYLKNPTCGTATVLSRKEQMEEFMFLGLRMNCGVSRADFKAQFGISIDAIYKKVLEELHQEGLLERSAGRIYLTEKGQDIANYVMAKFLIDKS
ncbi:MAG: oxygen-independent coproporphyrinogen III oxidase [Lachnospiraceae bacterium]|nr:oxygen-independent coproporphyrinogen III oxidase [Lachnospiraceae bacterium]